MRRLGTEIVMMGILVATTVGAGIFALPWVFHNSGWIRTTGWLIALSVLVVFAGYSYWRILDSVKERKRLVGLSREYLGREWGFIASIGVVGGILLTLVVYLILAQRFLAILLPLSPVTALILFWALAILPVTFGIRRFAVAEGAGALIKSLLIIFIFLSVDHYGAVFESGTPIIPDIFFPFGVLLFALAGWNAIEPMYEYRGKRESAGNNAKPLRAIAGGTTVIAVLYFLFSAGILGSLGNGSFVSPDTLSGLIGWPFWKLALLALLGLMALWTAYGVNAREVENALNKDLHWNTHLNFAVVAFAPLLVVFMGFQRVIQTVSFAGAVFVGLQYMTIFVLAERILEPRPWMKWSMRLAGLVFALAVLYEVYASVLG